MRVSGSSSMTSFSLNGNLTMFTTRMRFSFSEAMIAN